MSDGKRIHFIGIGGVGMSGIALVAHKKGYVVTGSDLKDSRYSRSLVKAGIPVSIGHVRENLGNPLPDVIVISSAIPDTNPELAAAHELGIEVWPRAKMLAKLGEGRKTLAVAGTHGKTTTSSMLATTLDRMGIDPTFLIGGFVDGYDTNATCGDGDYFVVEADESDGSFVYLDPYIALVTNIEEDHLDHYGSLAEIESAFVEFMSAVPAEGAVVIDGDDLHLPELAKTSGKRVISYGFCDTCDVQCALSEREGAASAFTVKFPDGRFVAAHLNSNPGRHNVANATGVLAALWALGHDVEKAALALSAFSGVRRRFDRVGEVAGVTVVDDYGHHPTEIRATLQAASELGYKHVHVLFQPHRYSRTQALAEDFGAAFDDADTVTFMDVYSAGEAPIPGVTGKTLVDSVLAHDPRHTVAWMPHRLDIVNYLASRVGEGDLVLTMGAGDVTTIGPMLVEELAEVER